MESKRQAKINRLLQRELSMLFIRNAQKWMGIKFISVSNVKVSPDLSTAKIYVTFLNEKEPLELAKKLNTKESEVKAALAQTLKNDLRKIPALTFFYDDTLDYVEKMDKLFSEINKDQEDKTVE